MIQRQLYRDIWKELAREKAMIFMAGPRQAGKTTLAEMIADDYANTEYFNWDVTGNKARLIKDPLFFEKMTRKDSSRPLVVFDEIHKYANWKNYLKGVYDECRDRFNFLVSGSGRLDLYQKGGDSLAGRYYMFHLWPFTVGELAGRSARHSGAGLASLEDSVSSFVRDPLKLPEGIGSEPRRIWDRILNFSGFPEPYLSGRNATFRRWSDTYARQLIREDIRDISGLTRVEQIETLYALLPDRVGSPLSLNSLAEDLKVSPVTVGSWIAALERFFMVFRISPWTKNLKRAIHKEKKLYLLNVPLVEKAACRFENAVAMELFRAVSNWNDLGYGPFGLYYIRDKEKREVDFLLARENRPFVLIETKLSETDISPSLAAFQKILKVPAVQLISEGEGFRMTGREPGTLVAPAWMWLAGLP